MTDKERKQVKAVLATIRTENDSISKRLASIISLVESARTAQLGIEEIIRGFEEKLNKIK